MISFLFVNISLLTTDVLRSEILKRDPPRGTGIMGKTLKTDSQLFGGKQIEATFLFMKKAGEYTWGFVSYRCIIVPPADNQRRY